MGAWFKENLARFAHLNREDIVGRLSTRNNDENLDALRSQQESWRHTTDGLIASSKIWLHSHPEAEEWTILLEYELPRRSRRVDGVILARDVVVLIEFKDGATGFGRADRWQAEQYALDIRDFHDASRGREIVPFLVATGSQTSPDLPDYVVGERVTSIHSTGAMVHRLGLVDSEGLTKGVSTAFTALSQRGSQSIDSDQWNNSAYMPAPWIVQAAREIFQNQDVREIKAAGSKNLDQTVEGVTELVEECRSNNRHGIAFITGAPGSGKTLAGLHVVHRKGLVDDDGEAAGVFLSGNQPLVEVIRNAIAEDPTGRGGNKISKLESERRVQTFIQHAITFRNEYAYKDDAAPPEHLILFDEAQRAWDARKLSGWRATQRKTSTMSLGPADGSDKSEPELFLEIMGRVQDWSVIIAVVGSGQEINDGEAGLGEWGKAIVNSTTDWVVRASPHVLPGKETLTGGPLVQDRETLKNLTEDPRLHLVMNVRSPRAEALNMWVDSLIELNLRSAREHFIEMQDFPLVLTRDLGAAKKWLSDRTDRDHRCDLVASAHAKRLRAWGLNVGTLKAEKSWKYWYNLNKGDIRSSNQLEVAANTYDCQGLELDWVGMCWGSDVIPDLDQSSWITRRLSGGRWQRANGDSRKYSLNGYRVLLTRARKGMVIWVPSPEGEWMMDDHTLDAEALDRVARTLMETGVPLLEPS